MSFVATVILGAGHLASWDAQFSNSSEVLLWKVCSVAVIVIPVLIIILKFIDKVRKVPYPLMFASVFLYIITRAYLLILLVFSFTSLPSAMYDMKSTNWLNLIPFFH